MTLAATDPFNWNALVTLFIAIFVAWNTWRLEQRAKSAREEAETLKKVAVVVEKIVPKLEKVPDIAVHLEKVEAHISGECASKLAKIEAQAMEIKILTSLLSDQKATAQLLAQSTAITAATTAPEGKP